MADIPGSSSTTATIAVGGTVSATLETLGDHDWFRITLTAGQSITVFVDGTSLEDPYLYIRNSAGSLLYENDDIVSGVDRDSRLSFTATETGTYYIDVGAWDEGYTGDYQVSVSVYTPPPLASLDQIANQLTDGYWGGDDHHFNVTQGGSITVNITALTPAGQNLAREALKLWGDVIGVQFVEVGSGGQISFNDNEEGAFSDGSWSGGIITSAFVNVSTQWLASYGTGTDSYSFQTYVHEIGHALGLGHAGNYNGEANYPYDALFENDAWVTSIMSYFDQTDNTYFAGQGFTENFVVTPMIADIVAMSTLYGLSTTTRTGNTTYGFNSTAGRAVYDASQNPGVAYAIFDSGGTDTLDYSGFNTDQRINLNAETFSNVGFGVGNVSIARGVVIENAIGGSGWDTLIGNSANNVLNGGGGTVNTISYQTATSSVTIDTSITGPQNTGGAGTDTLLNYQILIGSSFNDTLIGRNGTETQQVMLRGGDGNDTLTASSDGDKLYGEAGDDTLNGGPGADWLDGGSGTNLFYAGGGNDTLYGGEGNETLDGGAGADGLLGGAGNDTYFVDDSGDVVSESNDAGTDIVHSSVSFSLWASNIENLTLTGSAAITGEGSGAANIIIGNDASNVLQGRHDNDMLAGNGGDDALLGGYQDDILDGGSGSDTASYADIFNGVTVSLAVAGAQNTGAGLDTLVSIENLAGSDFNDTLTGNASANVLNGGLGTDTLVGGLGDDVFVIDQAGDLISEVAGQGDDTVVAKASFALAVGTSVEVMTTVTASATTAINLTGNEFGQSLYGNAGNNILTGNGGADYLVGLGGNDWYFVDTLDFITESNGGGDDWIFVADSYILREGGEIETLVAVNQDSLDPVNLTGNEYGQSLYGSQGVNSLNGGAGNDYLVGLGGNDFLLGGAGNDNLAGGAGNDIYYVDAAGDWVMEASGEGDDLVVAFASHALHAGESVETLSAAEGAGAINLTGNALAQSLYGNDGANVLTTGGGADYLVGGAGNDSFVLSNAPGVATIADYAGGEVVDISQVLSVANGTNVIAGGYLKVTSGGLLQVDVSGGANSWVTIANVSGSGNVTIRYLAGGSATDLSVARVASQSSADAKTSADDAIASIAATGDGLGQADAPITLDGADDASHGFATFAPMHDAFAIEILHLDTPALV